MSWKKRVDKPIGSIYSPSPPVALCPPSQRSLLGHLFSHARHPGGRHLPKSVDECNTVASQVLARQVKLGLSNNSFLLALSRPSTSPQPPRPRLLLTLFVLALSQLIGDHGAVNHHHHHHHRTPTSTPPLAPSALPSPSCALLWRMIALAPLASLPPSLFPLRRSVIIP